MTDKVSPPNVIKDLQASLLMRSLGSCIYNAHFTWDQSPGAGWQWYFSSPQKKLKDYRIACDALVPGFSSYYKWDATKAHTFPFKEMERSKLSPPSNRGWVRMMLTGFALQGGYGGPIADSLPSPAELEVQGKCPPREAYPGYDVPGLITWVRDLLKDFRSRPTPVMDIAIPYLEALLVVQEGRTHLERLNFEGWKYVAGVTGLLYSHWGYNDFAQIGNLLRDAGMRDFYHHPTIDRVSRKSKLLSDLAAGSGRYKDFIGPNTRPTGAEKFNNPTKLGEFVDNIHSTTSSGAIVFDLAFYTPKGRRKPVKESTDAGEGPSGTHKAGSTSGSTRPSPHVDDDAESDPGTLTKNQQRALRRKAAATRGKALGDGPPKDSQSPEKVNKINLLESSLKVLRSKQKKPTKDSGLFVAEKQLVWQAHLRAIELTTTQFEAKISAGHDFSFSAIEEFYQAKFELENKAGFKRKSTGRKVLNTLLAVLYIPVSVLAGIGLGITNLFKEAYEPDEDATWHGRLTGAIGGLILGPLSIPIMSIYGATQGEDFSFNGFVNIGWARKKGQQ
jgi:hypothetical protein